MTEFMKPPGMALDSGPNLKGERRDVDVDNKARDGEIPSQRDPLGVQVSNVSRQHMIMAERLDFQDSKTLLESWSFQMAQQRLIYEILGQMQIQKA